MLIGVVLWYCGVVSWCSVVCGVWFRTNLLLLVDEKMMREVPTFKEDELDKILIQLQMCFAY